MKTRFFIYCFCFLGFVSCKQVGNEKAEEKKSFKEDVENESTLSNLFFNHKDDTLKLFYRKNECGEWGGSSYVIGFYEEQYQVKCYYKYYEANCEILENTPEIPLSVKKESTMPLTKEVESLAIFFIKELLDNQFHESSGFHAENLFAVKMGNQINLFRNGGTERLHDLAKKIIDELHINK